MGVADVILSVVGIAFGVRFRSISIITAVVAL